MTVKAEGVGYHAGGLQTVLYIEVEGLACIAHSEGGLDDEAGAFAEARRVDKKLLVADDAGVEPVGLVDDVHGVEAVGFSGP